MTRTKQLFAAIAGRLRLIEWRWSLNDVLSSVAGGLTGAVIGLIFVVAWNR
ncbi:hypothetical protein [Streptomyces sp. ISL-100]|uniref:hypothetical protein n=1 Tax=Streptomyces sp. ISL-100 TaxID=2819173 RepID=UPI001BEA8309|nr:hypothetical protein [Streptomyces sp. ISL-100]MBT2398365.1 hypothetical protein [Streptomyces sp. ISL-100]